MANSFFQFKNFTIYQDKCAMKVTTDGCLLGAWIAASLKNIPIKNTILDIGAGTGLLSLMMAQKNKLSKITAVEIQEDDYKQCVKNIAESIFADNITVVHTDIQYFEQSEKFDIIVSNPPFYQNHLTGPHKNKNKAHHHTSLDFTTLAASIKDRLQDYGCFFLLVPFVHLSLMEKELSQQNFNIYSTCFVKQTPQHNYFRVMIQGGNIQSASTISSDLVIKENNRYSVAFEQLLRDYYLYL